MKSFNKEAITSVKTTLLLPQAPSLTAGLQHAGKLINTICTEM